MKQLSRHFAFIPARPSILQPLSARERWKIVHRAERMIRKGYPHHEIDLPVRVSVGTVGGFMLMGGNDAAS